MNVILKDESALVLFNALRRVWLGRNKNLLNGVFNNPKCEKIRLLLCSWIWDFEMPHRKPVRMIKLRKALLKSAEMFTVKQLYFDTARLELETRKPYCWRSVGRHQTDRECLGFSEMKYIRKYLTSTKDLFRLVKYTRRNMRETCLQVSITDARLW